MINVTTSLPFAGFGLAIVAIISLKWLRVAQREHYLPGYVFRFAQRWYLSRDNSINVTIAMLMTIAVIAAISRPNVATLDLPALGMISAFGLVSPVGLGLRGRSSKLKWTRRAKMLFAVIIAISAVLAAFSVLVGLSASLASVFIVLTPAIVEAALWITQPLEARITARYVQSATTKLETINPRRVAITGSFGKTSTKNYLAQICAHSFVTVASPASFNNRVGLALAVNENLAPGTEIFIAEMGAYQKGEIASLVSWVKPDIAAITAIGPVHLERFGSEDEILLAKSEITQSASCVVLNADDYRLVVLAGELERAGKKVWRVSGTDFSRDVCVLLDDNNNAVAYYKQRRLGATAIAVAPSNLAIAIAIALELGVSEDVIGLAIETLVAPPNRLNIAQSESGVIVIDDTYNSNPTGARLALDQLKRLGASGSRLVVVTPGMVELGDRQVDENRDLGTVLGEVATDLVVVGTTNKRALERGALASSNSKASGLRLLSFRTREQAVDWVKSNLTSGDVVLYENDLPDHYS